MNQTFIDRLYEEGQDIARRHGLLTRFIASDTFKSLPEHHKLLLKKQLAVMAEFGEILCIRHSILTAENAR